MVGETTSPLHIQNRNYVGETLVVARDRAGTRPCPYIVPYHDITPPIKHKSPSPRDELHARGTTLIPRP